MSNATDPAKNEVERLRVELAMLDFRPGTKRALPVTAQIDGIDRALLFGNARLPLLAWGAAPFPRDWGPHR